MPIFKQIKQHKILLDTHVWYWLMVGDMRLKKSFRESVEFCAEHDNILISAISIWEIGMLVEKKRIELDMDCLDWVEQALNTRGINLIPICPKVAIQSTRLPDSVHGDPADRILIATAHEHHAMLISHDKEIIRYGKGQFINVYDPV